MTPRTVAAAAAALALGLAACGTSSGPAATSPSPSGSVPGSITVFAAASLTESFTLLGRGFEAAHPGARVRFSFGASSTLAAQITEKAPADVFAAASTTTMRTDVDAGLTSTPTTFAVNTMQIATPTDATTSVTSLADLARPGVTVAVCQAAVPCGAAAQKLFERNGLAVTPTTEEVDVKAVLAKVKLGEVDAGVVYVTDVRAAGSTVVGVPIDADQNVTTDYPIAVVKDSADVGTAQAFVDYVLSPAGQQVLEAAGFSSP